MRSMVERLNVCRVVSEMKLLAASDGDRVVRLGSVSPSNVITLCVTSFLCSRRIVVK